MAMKVYTMRTSDKTSLLMDFQTELWYRFPSIRMFNHEKVKTYMQRKVDDDINKKKNR